MAVGVRLEFEGATQDQYDATYRRSIEADMPAGLILHSAGPIEDGWGVIDLWESREAFDRFAEHRLRPAAEEAGAQALPAAPGIKEFPVHSMTRPWLLRCGSLTLSASSPAVVRARGAVSRLSATRQPSPAGPGVLPVEEPVPMAAEVAEGGPVDEAVAAGEQPVHAGAEPHDPHAEARAQEWT